MVIFKEPGKGQFFLWDVQSLGNSGPLSSSADSTARMLWVFRVGCGDKRRECAFKNEGKIKTFSDKLKVYIFLKDPGVPGSRSQLYPATTLI